MILIAFVLSRIDVYGFKQFCEYFLSKFPGYFVSPRRLSGSAVFSQFKYNANGKLDAANCTVWPGYRDEEPSLQILPLNKKTYGK